MRMPCNRGRTNEFSFSLLICLEVLRRWNYQFCCCASNRPSGFRVNAMSEVFLVHRRTNNTVTVSMVVLVHYVHVDIGSLCPCWYWFIMSMLILVHRVYVDNTFSLIDSHWNEWFHLNKKLTSFPIIISFVLTDITTIFMVGQWGTPVSIHVDIRTPSTNIIVLGHTRCSCKEINIKAWLWRQYEDRIIQPTLWLRNVVSTLLPTFSLPSNTTERGILKLRQWSRGRTEQREEKNVA